MTGTDSITAAYKDEWVLPDAALPSAPSPEATQFVVYNPGTERADTIIRVAGASGDKMTIRNAATEQECHGERRKLFPFFDGSISKRRTLMPY